MSKHSVTINLKLSILPRYAFQAFGQGPRGCVGMRFALLEMKMAVLATWHSFSFLPGVSTRLPLTLDHTSQLSWVKGGLWAKIQARKI